ncbi:MAG: ABC transporter substrate-binding protein [Bacteroidota bacterium]|nr:ABC transporter substrate-binding protein [Bacteroidota bacterium]
MLEKKVFKILSLILCLIFVTNIYSQENIFRKSKKEIKVAILMPLFYDNIDELSFNQYNIAEKRSKPYKCFSYISFYEGVRIALDVLEQEGYKISLHVFDVGENDTNKTKEALQYNQMKDMNLIVPLVFKNSFDMVSLFAEQNHIPLVNPMSTSNEILKNEYVFKIQPDEISKAQTIMKYIQEKHPKANVIVLYENDKSKAKLIDWYKNNIASYTSSWTMINYTKNAAKLKSYLKPSVNNIVINLIEKNNINDNKVFANTLIKKLFALSSYKTTLFASFDWLDYNNIDYSMLEKLDYHFSLTYLNDYTNPNFVNFVKEYRKHFKTEPDKFYAALGYDIMLYFINALNIKGNDFQSNPNIKNNDKMINHYHFKHIDDFLGWQNETTTIYNIRNYKIKSEWSY